MPRFFGYTFNPVSFYYCYDIIDALKIIVLEVNNTFGEKHLYILDRDSEADKSTRLGENVTYKNNTPMQRYRKKLVVTASGHSYSLNLLSVIYAIMTYLLEIFLTMPCILYYKNLGIYHRPIPIVGTVVKLDPNFIDSKFRYAQEIITKYLFYFVSKHTSIIHIIIHLPDPNLPPIQIYPDNYNEHALQNIKHIKISLHNYSFFINLLIINQNLYRALLIGYFEKAWDCDDLPALIDLLFNHSCIIEDDLKDKCDNLIHRDNKQRLYSYESKTAMIKRWYWKKILGDENSGDIKLKQEFDEMLHSLWPAEGVDQYFIASIAQNDICFDLRLKAIAYICYYY
ncbi:DUF1365 domain-containing protein [Gigaspora margarita]|uniref:DUF1365 domain-containing protein n=1 Tax=Gigaspora margarita TaxID=4874 RepID=A0A8H4ANQ1_GIGMA|nr:DUF1365 domain-containing protein [Gigaspora margarita]